MILDQAYKTNPAVSNSMMKAFVKEGPKIYFDKFVDPLRQAPIEFSTESTDIGDLVDCQVTQPHKFNDFYYIMSDVPGESVKGIIERARELTIKDWTHDPQDCSIPLEEALQQANVLKLTKGSNFLLQAAAEYINPKTGEQGYRKNYKPETLEDYLIKEGAQYYEDLAIAAGRKIIDIETDNTAKKVEKAFRDHDVISKMLWPEKEEGVETFGQLMITVEMNGVQCKILLDNVRIDRNTMRIYPRDVKTSISHKQFMINYYNLMYGQQGSFYSAVLKVAYPLFTIMPFEFIVGCTESGENPMIYRMSDNELELQKRGAITKSGAQVPGWNNTLEQLKWHYANGTWLYPKEVYENGYLLLDSYSADAIQSLGNVSSMDDFL